MKTFDILVLGGGHAGLEAAYLASQFNLSVGILTLPGVGLGSAPCNPSVGGVGKGQVVREIDALGGLMGILADRSGIQYRTLNDSKGFAVQSSRVQIDKEKYSCEAELVISTIPNIEIIREKVNSICRSADLFQVEAQNTYLAKKIIITVGTFLNGKLHTGSNQTSGGRINCEKSTGLNDLLSFIKTSPQRFKTGTPPRLSKLSIDYSKLEEQPSDDSVRNFHILHQPFIRRMPQVSCYLAHTNSETMKIIRINKEKSPMYNGQIKGIGARYCPSIEDKAFRYPDKDIHHVFIEPEGLNLDTVYPSGISSSLPQDIQASYVQTICGLESAEIKEFGYAVEYDVLDTTELTLTLEHKLIKGLYFAGQVNGTSGYEEAAGQGLVAGINAALALEGRGPFILNRHDSYIGVMIEDLVSNTRDEPYRLFTARSENRLFIREDNTIIRMWRYRNKLGLNTSLDNFERSFVSKYEDLMDFCDETMISEKSSLLKSLSGVEESQQINRSCTITEILKQAWLNPVTALNKILNDLGLLVDVDLIRVVGISKKYEGYIKRSEDYYGKIKKMDNTKIDWKQISTSSNISFECKQRIIKIKPETFGQLKLIDGIRPATLAVVASGSI